VPQSICCQSYSAGCAVGPCQFVSEWLFKRNMATPKMNRWWDWFCGLAPGCYQVNPSDRMVGGGEEGEGHIIGGMGGWRWEVHLIYQNRRFR
jgi:hypothetical protein